MAEETIILEPQRTLGHGCCDPCVEPRLSDASALRSAEILKALADPARLQILDMLLQQGGRVCVCDFEDRVGLPDPATGQRPRQPTISHHLRVLRAAGIVEYEKRGQWAYYFIRPDYRNVIQTIMALLG